MKVLSKILKIILNCFFIIWLFINTIIVIDAILKPQDIPGFFGFKPYVVISGSNETDMEYGDFVISKKTDNLKENDIVIVKTNNRKATSYRINSIDGDNLKLENETNTKIILSKNSIEGKSIICIKNFGEIALAMKKPVVVVVLVVLTIIFGVIIYKIKMFW